MQFIMNSLNLNIQTRHKSVVRFQIYSSKDLEDSLNKIREVLSDDKQDWEHRVTAVSRCFHFFCPQYMHSSLKNLSSVWH